MPIKLPKGFQRRKSSGNVLDDVQSPPGESSFKVLERPASKGKSFDGGMHLRMVSTGSPIPPPKDQYARGSDLYGVGRPDASNRYSTSSFVNNDRLTLLPRGSGGTERSQSTAHYDSAASSARLSTSSTNPSSIDTKSEKNTQSAAARSANDVSVLPTGSNRPSFLRSPVKTFSFSALKGSGEAPASPDAPAVYPPTIDNRRNRTVTESTASTATPPRLFDSDLALDNSELEDFGNMFDHIGSSPDPAPVRLIHQEVQSRLRHFLTFFAIFLVVLTTPIQVTNSSPTTMYPPTAYPGAAGQRVSRAPPPLPISVDRSQHIESSPYSWNSQTSHDGLIRSPSPSKTITQGSPMNKHPAPQSGRFGSMSDKPGSAILRRPVVPRKSTQDDDLHPAPLSPTRSKESNPPVTSSTRDALGVSPASEYHATLDTDLAENAQLANMYQETKEPPSKPLATNKVMTPEQWERYKKQKEMDSRLGALSDDSGSEVGDQSDDEDEVERTKQAAKQRRKQEAHLAVYRQTMMKVTGETPPARTGSSLSVYRQGDASPIDLSNRVSQMTVGSKNSGGDDGDEDEDVPLGILAAHGFPNKNRPPTRLGNSASNPNLRAASLAGAPTSGRGGNLPVFARQLPQDPYYGASLVQPSNREALTLHSNPVPIGAGPSTAHPIHPSGLVGVIAGEERARAARRGSPNPTGGYDVPQMPPHPGMMRSQTAGSLATMGYPQGMPPMPGMPPMLTPGDQAQIQMAQQMNQMMQMQMQWMQQMSQTMNGQMPPNPMGMPPFSGPLDPAASRPQSIQMHNTGMPHAGQRTMSTLNPSMAPWNNGAPVLPSINVNGNYAPSIAPSERSNIGLAPRYRPVSTAPEPEQSSYRRASTFTSSTVRPFSSMDMHSRAPQHQARPSVNTLGRRSPLAQQDDEDDEQAWAEMKLKKDKKQKTWALRKGQNALQELYNPAS
jgi:hypothetical protein